MYPTEKWRHKLKFVKLEKILKFADSAIFGDSCPPRNYTFFATTITVVTIKYPGTGIVHSYFVVR
jgi:hypothetical protein